MKKQSQPPSFHRLALAAVMLGLVLMQSARAASWVTNGSMITGRSGQTATLLPNGKILVAGGSSGFSFGGQQYFGGLASAELYDPATGTWTNTGSLNEARYGHTATLLPNGEVLVVGGIASWPYPAVTSELYHPDSGTWTTTTQEPVGRFSHTATLLRNGKVLVVGGYGPALFGPLPLSSSELFDPSTETWTNAGTMLAEHAGHTATLLPDGKVLIVGGAYVGFGQTVTVTNTVELYDPVDGTWTATGPLNIERNAHTATLLPNGLVLVAGGYGTNDTLDSAELYNPSNGTWTLTGALSAARYDHSATLLPNGKVLVAGGIFSHFNTNDFLATAEIYSPSDGTWTPTVPLNTPRYDHTATLLPGGNVLIAGGIGTNAFLDSISLSSTEVYDPTIYPATGMWTNTGAMNVARMEYTATLLPNGDVLVAGGQGIGIVASSELFDPATQAWTMTSSMNAARHGHTSTLLPNGQVLVAGGDGGENSAELYDLTTGLWTLTNPMTTNRFNPTATLLPDGKVLVAGGFDMNGPFASAELYNPTTRTWTATGPMNEARYEHTATLLPNEKVLVAGGYSGFSFMASAELYDPANGTWTRINPLTTARGSHAATLLQDGRVLIAGGASDTNMLSSTELFDPVTDTWTNSGALNFARDLFAALLLPDGKVLITGGYDGTYALASAELYDPATGEWTVTGALNTPRYDHTMTLLPSGRVLIAGGVNSKGVVSSTELYDIGLERSKVWQPQITAFTSPLNLGSSLVIAGAQFRGVGEGSSGNTQDSAADYPLVQLRSLESGQTTFLLTTNWSTNSFASKAVWNFPPGWALATVFVNGIQSTSAIVNISVPVPTATTLTGTAMANGGFQFVFTNSPGALFGVLTATNLSIPATNWTALGGVVEVAPGQFQFTDPQATNGGQRYYQLYSLWR